MDGIVINIILLITLLFVEKSVDNPVKNLVNWERMLKTPFNLIYTECC